MENLILHPTDFSECANKALEYAVRLCEEYQAELVLVHSVNPEDIEDFSDSGRSMLQKSKELEDAARLKLNELGKSLSVKGINCRAQLYSGSLSSKLITLVNQLNPLMVVMGTTGAGSISNKIFGSNTYALIQSSSAPVLAVPDKHDFRPTEKISLAVDLKSMRAEVLNYLLRFTKVEKAKLEILYVMDEQDEEQFNLEVERVKKQNPDEKVLEHTDFQLLVNDNYIEGIREYIEKVPTDIFAVTISNRNFIEKLLFGSLSKHLVHHSKIPLLAIPTDLK